VLALGTQIPPSVGSEKGAFVSENKAIRRSEIEQLATATMSSGASVLHSWKEISAYLGFGVRTAQRYEVHLGLPIHRPAAKSRCAVMAFSDELNVWLKNCPTRDELPAVPQSGTAQSRLPVLHQPKVSDTGTPKLGKFKAAPRENLYPTYEPMSSRTAGPKPA
jgi:hypothetical protein